MAMRMPLSLVSGAILDVSVFFFVLMVLTEGDYWVRWVVM